MWNVSIFHRENGAEYWKIRVGKFRINEVHM
jgi:hypothetical protein